MTNTTIAAIATPLGPGGIGIIRISGPEALGILKSIFIPQRCDRYTIHPSEFTFNSHQVYYGHIIDSDENSYIDEVLAIYMRGPKSFTREDVAEIHSHSGFVVLDRILSIVFDAGATLAQPGEFIKRAFINGRIDLTQAEAVIDLINAPGEKALQMASQQIAGGFRKTIEDLISKIRSLQARCEAIIEFEETENIEPNQLLKEIQEDIEHTILMEINTLIKQQQNAAIFRDGIVLTITGIPNVGKSSLLNRLVQKETAIVSEIPGTTRDIIKEYVSINGIPVVLCDTAGIHDSIDPVECLGIERAQDQLEHADVVLMVVEATRNLASFEEKILARCDPKKTIIVINKDDLNCGIDMPMIEASIENFHRIRISAKFGNGIEQLRNIIFSILTGDRELNANGSVTPNLRQRKLLQKAHEELRCSGLGDAVGWEIISETLRNVILTLEEICGLRNQEDLYDHIFSQFCIGK
jgi:tRNA modification GTPase